MVKEILSAEEYSESKKSSPLVLVDFYADWCGPCKAIAPEIEKLEGKDDMKKKGLKVYKVNVDKLDSLAAEEGVSAMPTFLLFKGGKEVARIVGAILDKIEKAIEKHA